MQVAGREAVPAGRRHYTVPGPQLQRKGVVRGEHIRHVSILASCGIPSLGKIPKCQTQFMSQACDDLRGIELQFEHMSRATYIFLKGVIRAYRQKMTACQHQCQRCSMSAAAGRADLAQHSAASSEDETWTTIEVFVPCTHSISKMTFLCLHQGGMLSPSCQYSMPVV